MKNILALILFYLSFQTAGAWISKPISPPKLKVNEAIEIAMSYSKKTYSEYSKNKLSTFFVKKIEFSQADYNSLNEIKKREGEEDAKKVWGWKVEIIRLNDLTEKDEFFISNEGKVLHYISWH